MSRIGDELKRDIKSVKRQIVILDVSVMLLGLLMVVFPDTSQEIICRVVGVLLCVLGLLRVITYFTVDRLEIFGSFALVQGAAALAFGIYFLLRPQVLAVFLMVALALVLLVGGVMKLQYAFDFLRLKASGWWIELLGAALLLATGVVALLNPFGAADGLMIFLGICFLFDGVWDLVSVIQLSHVHKKVKQALEDAARTAQAVEADYVEQPDDGRDAGL